MATSSAPSHEPSLDRHGRVEPRALIFALLFALVTYALISSGAVLNPDRYFPLWSLPRLVSTLAGGLLFWIALRLVERWKRRPVPELALRALALVLPASIAIYGTRLLVDQVAFGDLQPATNVRWMLVWMGYFTASLTAAVAVHLYARIEQLSRAQQGDATVSAPSEEPAPAEESLWVQRQGGAVKVPVEAIEWIEAEGNYVRIHAGDASGLIRTPLTSMEARLGPTGFVRIHRSVVCRTSAIRAVKRRRTGAMLAQLGSGAEVPVGRSYGDRIKALQEASPALDVRPS